MQIANASPSEAAYTTAKGDRLRQITRAIWRSIDLPPGNPGGPIRNAVVRLATLRLIAERARSRALVENTRAAIDAVDKAERAAHRAQRDLAAAVAAKPENRKSPTWP